MKNKPKITSYVRIPTNKMAVLLSVILMFLFAFPEREAVFTQETNTVSGEDSSADDTSADTEEEKKELVKKDPINMKSQGYDVVYVIDNSKSVWKQQEIRNQAFRNITNLAVGADIRIGIVYFADHVYEDYKLSLTSMENADDRDKVMKKLDMTQRDYRNVDTNIGNALEEAAALFDAQDSSRKRIIILFSDGINENDEQEEKYKERADKKTMRQAKKLKKMDVQLHCVYLQQTRNDEEYLKELVNYFSDKNTFDKERFSKVEREDVDSLTDKFADVFYKMQNNMKYHKIKLDAEGKERFYVPSLGIRKLQIYVKEKWGNIQLFSEKESDYDYRGDPSATFYESRNPSAGSWTIQVDSYEPQNVRGTIAYYAYLQAAAELVRKDGAFKADKNAEYQLIVHFYDQNGDEVELDSSVEIQAEINSDENKISDNIALSVKDGVVKSEPFSVDFYGDFYFNVHLAYEDFVDMDYVLDGGTIGKMAPLGNNMDHQFSGEKTEEGLTAIVKESDLFKDPEDDTVTIEKVVQLNQDNEVSVRQEDGYVYITSKKAGDINFALKLKDASGMETEVAVQGTMKNEWTEKLIQLLIKLAVLAVVLLIIGSILRVLYRKRGIKKALVDFDRKQVLFRDLYRKCRNQLEKIDKLEKLFEQALYSDGKVTGVCLLADSLSEDQCRDFQIDGYLEEDFMEKSFLKTKEIRAKILKAEKNMDDFEEDKEHIKEHSDHGKAAYEEIKNCCIYAEMEVERFKKYLPELERQNAELNALLNRIEEAGDHIADLLETDIRCDLILEGLEGRSDVEGRKGCYSMLRGGSYLKGFYKLEDIRILGRETLGAYIGDTGVYVYGYSDKNGTPGLELRSENEFYCRCCEDDSEMAASRQMMLLQGFSYELEIPAQRKEVRMTVRLE